MIGPDEEGPGVDAKAHVTRGGSWCDHPFSARCSFRGVAPHIRSGHHGFRLVSPLPEK